VTSRATAALGAGLLLLLVPKAATGDQRFAEVTSQANVRLIAPPQSFDSYGADVYPMGDVNGDGFDDAGVDDRVIFGGPGLPRVVDLGTLEPSQGLELRGWAPRPAGDVGGDGMQDYFEITYPERGRRVVRVVHGTGTAEDLTRPDGAHGFTVEAGPSARLFGLIPAGDVNGDRLDDLAASVVNRDGRGYAAVVFGSRAADTVELEEPGPRGFRITGINAGTYACGQGDNYSEGPLGVALAAPGDVDRDGRADLLVGVGGGNGGCRPGPRGQALLLFGRPGSGSVPFSKVRSGALRIVGRGGSGAEVGAAGDVNGDRRPDLLVGEPGGAVLVFGRSRGGMIRLASLGAAGFKALAGEDYERGPLEGAGDLNGDGLGDFVAGSRVVFGKRSSSRVLLDELGRHGYHVLDRTSGAAGFPVGRVAPVGDMNGDRRPDLLAGTTHLGPPGAWVLFGNGPPLVSVAPLRSSALVDRPPRLDLPLLCPGNVARLCRGRVRLVLASGKAVFTARFRLAAGELRKRPGRLRPAAVRGLRLDGNVRLNAITAATDGRGRRAVTRRELYLIDRSPREIRSPAPAAQ
jgi:hypothetical protein